MYLISYIFSNTVIVYDDNFVEVSRCKINNPRSICLYKHYIVVSSFNRVVFCLYKNNNLVPVLTYWFQDNLMGHDAFIGNDGFLWVVDSKYSQLVRFDNDNVIKKTIRQQDINNKYHINCVTKIGNDFCYSAFSFYHHWRTHKDQGVLFVKNRVIIGGLSKPHSPFYSDGILYFCNSDRRELNVVDRGKNVVITKLNGFTRGLHIDKNIAFVGAWTRGDKNSIISRVDLANGNKEAVVKSREKGVYCIFRM